MFAPQMALRPEYDQQSIQQDYLYKSEHPNILTWIKWEGDGGGLKRWKMGEKKISSLFDPFNPPPFPSHLIQVRIFVVL